MSDGCRITHQDCGGKMIIEVETRPDGYQPCFYFECQECGEADRWNPGGWS